MIAFLLIHALGALVLAVVDRRAPFDALRTPASFFVGLALLFAASLGLPGVAIVSSIALGVWLSPRRLEAAAPLSLAPFIFIAGLTVWVLVRPWVPLYWDEFVWLAKARLGSLAFDGVVTASLDSTQGVIPAGYVPLWPSAVGWLSLGDDELGQHVFSSTLLVLACAGVAIEAWWDTLAKAKGWAIVVLISAPLGLVHLKSIYVDLPVGLLGLALLGRLLDARAGLGSIAIAVCLAGFKDEGVTQVLAATLAAVLASRREDVPFTPWWRRIGPLVAAVAVVLTWRTLLNTKGVTVSDHALNSPAWGWLSTFAKLLVLHASDVFSWGVTWAVVLAVVARRMTDRHSRALRWLLVGNFLLLTAALLSGPERVRVFAENGTLLNRLLLQSWPAAVALILTAINGSPPHGVAPGGFATPQPATTTLTDRAA
ncbi:MAG: hypothetical protein JNM17_09565 [Archangium sp.]|nr:hypothetical protein [Archangium sp.]